MVTANLDKLAVIHTDAATRRAAMISSRAPWAPCHPAVARASEAIRPPAQAPGVKNRAGVT